jgi:hypothetical protein
MVLFAPVIGHPTFLAGDDGFIYEKETMTRKSFCFDDGYPRIYLDGIRYKTHQLIIRSFMLANGDKIDYDLVVDHINNKRDDNRLENLRLVSEERNSAKQNKSNCSSKYQGVCWDKNKKKWRANCIVEGKSNYLGRFETEESAARAYDKFVLENGLDRDLNFPEVREAAL